MSTQEKYDRAGGPAFPVADPCEHGGMTLRDYFAGQALVAIAQLWKGNIGDFDDVASARTAMAAYHMANAMMKAREPESAPHVDKP
jgi:hypothetical protein